MLSPAVFSPQLPAASCALQFDLQVLGLPTLQYDFAFLAVFGFSFFSGLGKLVVCYL